MEPVYVAENKRQRLEIYSDEEPINPREECDNLGKMVCFHSRYRHLGDEKEYPDETSEEFLERIRGDVAVILPLYIYEHGGITMNTAGFSDRWDSSAVGYIYVTKQKVMDEYFKPIDFGEISQYTSVETLTSVMIEEMGLLEFPDELLARVKRYLEEEVDTYDKYLMGDVYGYRLTEKKTEEQIASTWGFYGTEWTQNGLSESVEEYAPKSLVEKLETYYR